jgi:hypothetical protein
MRKPIFLMILLQFALLFNSCEFFDYEIDIPILDNPDDTGNNDTGSNNGETSITCARFVNSSSSDCTEGVGSIQNQSYFVENFDKVQLAFCGQLQLSQGDFSVETNAQANILPLIDISVQNETLLIQLAENSCIAVNEAIIVNVSLPNLQEVINDGPGDISILGQWTNIDQITFNINSAGNISVEEEWNVQNLNIQTSSVGNILGFSPIAQFANVSVNGIGSVETHVTNELTGEITSVGDIYYKGNPTIDVDVATILGDIINAN